MTLITINVCFTTAIEDCFRLLKTNPKAFTLYELKLHSYIEDLITSFYCPMTNQEFSKASLILLLLNSQLQKVKDFQVHQPHHSIEDLWHHSLKFRFSDSTVTVEHGEISLSHRGEYWGECKPIIITPQTENAIGSLLRCSYRHQFPLLYSPEGTGKSSLIEFVASSMGSFFFKFKSFPNSSFQDLTQIIAGIAQSNSFLFVKSVDHFTR